MKGAELPINVMIIVVLAIIVFIAMVAFFMGVWGPSTGGVNVEAVKNTGCNRLVSSGCDSTAITLEDVNDDGTVETLQDICNRYYNCAYAGWTSKGTGDDNNDGIMQASEEDAVAQAECCRDRCNC